MNWQTAKALARAVRPHQWLSNLVVFAPLFFSYRLFQPPLLLRVMAGFFLLCGLSSVTFLVNDVVDRERDQRHPVRRYRPVATGEVTDRQALVTAFGLVVASLAGSYFLQPAFGLASSCYLLVMLGYSLGLRKMPVLDVMAVALGLVLRAVAGAVLIQGRVSPWLYLGVAGLGLILALGRVQHEMRLAEAAGTLEADKYTPYAVERLNSITLAMTLIVYCLYTFLAGRLPANHGMMLTIPIVIYGIFRYRYLSYKPKADDTANGAVLRSPERQMLSDRPLLVAAGLWTLTTLGALYLGGS